MWNLTVVLTIAIVLLDIISVMVTPRTTYLLYITLHIFKYESTSCGYHEKCC